MAENGIVSFDKAKRQEIIDRAEKGDYPSWDALQSDMLQWFDWHPVESEPAPDGDCIMMRLGDGKEYWALIDGENENGE